MIPLLLAALLAQAADAATTCRALHTGQFREVNPVMGTTCTQVVARKAAIAGAGYVVFYRHARLWSVGLTAAGTVGVTVNLAQRR